MADNQPVFVAAAFCPQPPLLHPAVGGLAGGDVGAQLREACAQALVRMLSREPESVLVLGAVDPPTSAAVSERVDAIPRGSSDGTGTGARPYGPGDAGYLFGYGVSVRVGFDGPPRDDAVALPLAHTLAAWLLDTAGSTAPRVGRTADAGAPDLGNARADRRRWALLVMGDGSARRTEKSPGWYHPDAVTFDEHACVALASGDGQALFDLDPAMGADVLAAGITSWRTAGRALAGTPMSGKLHYADAPYGVFSIVASWVSDEHIR